MHSRLEIVKVGIALFGTGAARWRNASARLLAAYAPPREDEATPTEDTEA